MGIGLLLGRDGPQGSKEPAYAAARDFLAAFRGRFGSTRCTDLIGHDISHPAGRIAARVTHAGEQRCLPVVAWSAGYLADLLARCGR
jgi:hypothetical protein